MGIFTNYISFNNQGYQAYVDQCRSSKSLFTDPTFPTSNISIDKNNLFPDLHDVIWKRPSEIVHQPRLVIDEAISILKGQLSNSSLPVTFMTIRKKETLKRIIPDLVDQEWNEKKPDLYTGIFKFRFWRHGELIEVVIDDYLPTIDGKLITITTSNENEFWCPLLEKAYAKLCGSYDLILNHTEEELLLDLTGGVPELIYQFQLQSSEVDNHFNVLNHEYNTSESSIIATANYDVEDTHGLSKGYKCCLSAIKTINIKNTSLSVSINKESLRIVRLCDPSWVREWNGTLSETSEEWKMLTSPDKVRLKLSYSNGGDFWMMFSDFLKYFDRIIVMRFPNMSKLSLKTRWFMSQGNEVWYGTCDNNEHAIEGRGGGGQFYFDVTRSPNDVVFIHVLQKCQKSLQVPMGVMIFQVERNRHTILFSTKWARLVHEYHLDNSRSVGFRCTLPNGSYVVKAYIKNCLSDQLFYHLRVFTTEENNGRFLLSEPLKKSPLICFCMENECSVITRVRIVRAIDIKRSTIRNYNVFCQIKCEEMTLRTQTVNDSEEFRWEEEFLLYRANPSEPIVFKLFNKCTIYDDFFGMVEGHYDSKFNNKQPLLMKFPLKDTKGAILPGQLEVAFWHTNSYVNL